MQDDDFTDIGDYEIYFAFAILKGKWKRDDIFYNYVALYLFKDYYVEKEFERFQVYVENTLKKLYNSILYRIESEYKEKIENEIKVYKKSPTYWENREKYIREKRKQKKSSNIYDGLNDELKKLEYWSPNLFASETHISYHTKATNQDASPSADWPDVYGFGFQASVSLQEYICGYASSYNDIKVSAFSNYFLQLMTEGCSRWKRLDTFASILLNWYIENGFRIFSIIREIREIFNLESDIGKMFFFSKEDCVLTNMQVKIKNIESKVEKQIVTNYSEDSFIYLGRLLGETFYNPVDNEKYTVIEIKS